MAQVVTADQAVETIRSGQFVVLVGSGGGVNDPAALLRALEARYLATGEPKDLTLYHPNGMGDGEGGGTERFRHPGFVRRIYGSHWSWAPELAKASLAGSFESVVWPQGVLSLLLRESAGGSPGLFTQLGVGTFADPRIGTPRPDIGKTLVRVWTDPNTGKEYLYYPAPDPDVVLLRASTADELGNLSMEREGVVLDVLTAASAVKRRGGIVIAQVGQLAKAGSLDPLLVRVPHYLVDYVVVDPDQRQSRDTVYNPAYAGRLSAPVPERPAEKAERALIARRAALEVRPGDLVNLGFGISDGVASFLAAQAGGSAFTFSVEQGTSGGVPAWGADFGLMWNPQIVLDAPSQFDLYHGRGVDLTVVSFAQVDREGSVNVSYFGGRLVGPGGFIDITRGARRVVFCGTFTARGLKVEVGENSVRIRQEGTVPKFVSKVDEITFSGPEAVRRGQEVLYVTERAVFRLTPEGLVLEEVAPGVDPVKDVLAKVPFSVRHNTSRAFPAAVLPGGAAAR